MSEPTVAELCERDCIQLWQDVCAINAKRDRLTAADLRVLDEARAVLDRVLAYREIAA